MHESKRWLLAFVFLVSSMRAFGAKDKVVACGPFLIQAAHLDSSRKASKDHQRAVIDIIARDPDRAAGIVDPFEDLSPRERVVKRLEIQRLLEEKKDLSPDIAQILGGQFQARILSDVSHNIVMTANMEWYLDHNLLTKVAIGGLQNPMLGRFFQEHSEDLLRVLYDAPYLADSLLNPKSNDFGVSFKHLTFQKSKKQIFVLVLHQKAGDRQALYGFAKNIVNFAAAQAKSNYSSGSDWLRLEHLDLNVTGDRFREDGYDEDGGLTTESWGYTFRSWPHHLGYPMYTHNMLHHRSWKRKSLEHELMKIDTPEAFVD